MKSPSTKKKILDELEKNGIVYLACAKSGVSRPTYYRWIRSDKRFEEAAKNALESGLSNNCDIAEHSLMKKVREGDLAAIKFQLSHNSERYKARNNPAEVVLRHITDPKQKIVVDKRTLEDLIDEAGRDDPTPKN